MSVQERIQRFIEKYPEPRQRAFAVEWENKKGRHHAIINNGSTPILTWRGACFIRRVSSRPYYIADYYYDEETELFCAAYLECDLHTPKSENETRHWKWSDRYFIPKEEKTLYNEAGIVPLHYTRANNGEWIGEARLFLNRMSMLYVRGEKYFNEAFMCLTDNNPDLPPRYVRTEGYYPWILGEWIIHKKAIRKSNNNDKLARLDIDLDDVPSEKLDKVFEENFYNYCFRRNMAIYDTEHKVFRCFYKSYSDEIYETHRAYYMPNGKFICVVHENGTWKTCPSTNLKNYAVCDNNFSYEKYMEYMDSIINRKGRISLYSVIAVSQRPYMEQLIKIGCSHIVERVMRYNHIDYDLNYEFNGNKNNKEKTVFEHFGITAKQFKKLDEFIAENKCNTGRSLSIIKKLLSLNKISDISPDDLYQYCNCIYQDTWSWSGITETFSANDAKKLLAKCKILGKEDTRILFDTINTWKRLNENVAQNINPIKFKNENELFRLHDTVVILLNQQMAEENTMRDRIANEAMKKIDEKRKKLNYSENNYSISLPQKVQDITLEGQLLHHCVGGYVDRHSKGQTTILFLRKNAERDRAFYTIELNNNNEIVQIHGFGNRWLGNDPDAIPTVMRWIKKNDIKCRDEILLCKSVGYCATREYVAKPTI